ncbi:hypothetical protein CANINC_002997 [Pichia inconspicua]|uniref:Complex 1 LYR protein domain-containing protein n=1 Tax=Pichia inconspicua TaxID=52247 RepID=A0A4T0WZV1_9ASCO|nr:hypothetical protein CANINC_002997 [[Candida] inconspicua]
MWQRGYSTLKDTTVRSLRKKRGGVGKSGDEFTPSLQSFVLTKQILQVYRSMLRDVGQLSDKRQRREVRDVVKGEFRSCANIPLGDVNTRRSLLVGGIRNWKSVANNMGLSI